MVATSVRQEFQDADSGRSRPARLQARRERRLPAFHYSADGRRAVEDAVFPRRRPLGAEATEFAAVVSDGKRLGGPVDEEVAGRRTSDLRPQDLRRRTLDLGPETLGFGSL